MDAIFTFISEHYPTIAIFIVGGIIGGFVVRYHIAIQNTRKKVDKLPCDAHGEQIDLTRRIFDAHTEKLDDMREVLVGISAALINKKMIDPASVLQKLSPFRLTVEGEKHLINSGGKACIDENLEYFLSELEKTNPQNALDVENGATSILWSNSRKPFFNDIKNYVFLDPQGISLLSTIAAMGNYLRDKYFEIHPELLPDGVQIEQIETV